MHSRHNTEGSQECMMELRARKNMRLLVSEEQRDVLIGCILGDAYISALGKIQIEHSVHQRSYVEWKYDVLRSISYGPPTRVDRWNRRTGMRSTSYRFWTRQFFRTWRSRFYPHGVKIVPNDLERLTPLTMAVWHMDDGCCTEGRRILIAIDGFNATSRMRARRAIEHAFAITTNFKGGKLQIGTRQTRVLAPIIRPYIIPSMVYKIPDPVTTEAYAEIGGTPPARESPIIRQPRYADTAHRVKV